MRDPKTCAQSGTSSNAIAQGLATGCAHCSWATATLMLQPTAVSCLFPVLIASATTHSRLVSRIQRDNFSFYHTTNHSAHRFRQTAAPRIPNPVGIILLRGGFPQAYRKKRVARPASPGSDIAPPRLAVKPPFASAALPTIILLARQSRPALRYWR